MPPFGEPGRDNLPMLTGLILAVPGLTASVQDWRRAVLPGARLDVPPHLTVLYPWVRREPVEEDHRRVVDATRELRSFVLTFRDVGTFPGFVWLRPEPSESVRAVHRAIAAAFADFPPYAGEHADVVPHLTVATCEPGDTPALAAAVAAALADPAAPGLGPFRAEGVDVAMRHSDQEPFTVRRLATFPPDPEPMLGPP